MENIKKCTGCGRELPLDQFYKKRYKSGNVGYQCYCKSCKRAAKILWRKNNLDKIIKQNIEWRENNPEYNKKWRENNPEYYARWLDNNPEYHKKWRENNPDKMRKIKIRWRKANLNKINTARAARDKERKIIDPNFKLKQNIRDAIRKAFKNNTKSGRTVELLGCSIEYLRQYLENQFTEGMTWSNYGLHGWHLDHIIPVSYFDLSDPEQQKRAWHYTNLRPMWAIDNIQKSNKIIEIQLVLL